MSEKVVEVQQDSAVQVDSHPIVLDMLAGLMHFIDSPTINCEVWNNNECACDTESDCKLYQDEEVVVHKEEYVTVAYDLYQEAAERILTNEEDQWLVLADMVTRLKAIEFDGLSTLMTFAEYRATLE